MRYGTRLASGICLATIFVFCLSALLCFTQLFVTPVHAAQKMLTGSVTSSPSSGPVGATISVSGSGWSEPDGEQVTFGYMVASFCSIISGTQAGTFKSGSFSGSFHFPAGTPLGSYSICAEFGTTTAIANTYTILTESMPQISIALSTQSGAAQSQATVSGSNYYPTGTSVNLAWETTNGNVIFTIPPAVSNSGGHISKTFNVPASVSSGPYKVAATITGQPALTSSAAFTYSAPTPTPTPTPSPTTPSPTPDPTVKPSPTAVTTPVANPNVTPTVVATSLPGSQNSSQTPAAGTSSSDTQLPIIIIGATAGILVVSAVILLIAVYHRRKKARDLHIAAEVGSAPSNPMTWQNYQANGTPHPMQNSSMPAPLSWPTTSAPSSPQQLQMSPYAHLLQQPVADQINTGHEPNGLQSGNADLDAIKQQVQMGLFAAPGARADS